MRLSILGREGRVLDVSLHRKAPDETAMVRYIVSISDKPVPDERKTGMTRKIGIVTRDDLVIIPLFLLVFNL